MSGVRALRRADLPQVVALYELVQRSRTLEAPVGMAEYFRRTLLEHPWADPEIPSLVYEAPDGEIVAFLGTNPRRLRLDGRAVRMACSSTHVAHPDWRSRGVGALLVRRFLAGPQELSITDGGNDAARDIWLALRGQILVHASIGWFRVFRPGSAVHASLAVRRRSGFSRRAAAMLARPVDTLALRTHQVRDWLVPREPDCTSETLTIEGLLEQAQSAGLRLRPDYDASYVQWLFRELNVMSLRGRLVRHLVRGAHGRVLGWYLYFLPYRGIAQVLQVGVRGTDPGPVLDHMLWHAHHEGAAAVHGRLEPVMVSVLEARACLLRKTSWALVHSEDPAILALLGTPQSLVSRLEGEWWMGHHNLWRRGVTTQWR